MRTPVLLLLLFVLFVASDRRLRYRKIEGAQYVGHFCGDNPDDPTCKKMCDNMEPPKDRICLTKKEYEDDICEKVKFGCARNSLYCKKHPTVKGCVMLEDEDLATAILECNYGGDKSYCDPKLPTDEEFLQKEEEEREKELAARFF